MFIKLNTNKETAGTLKALGVLLHTVSDNRDEDIARIIEDVNHPMIGENESIGFKVVPYTPASASLIPADVDSAGVHYDSELHSSNRSKNKDGTWRERRTAKTEPVTAETSSAPAVVSEGMKFSEVLNNITKCIETNKLTKAQITQILNNFDVPSVAVLSNYPQHFTAINIKLLEALNG